MMRNFAKGLAIVIIAASASAINSTAARADSPCGGVQALNCTANSGGISTDLRSRELDRAKRGLDIATGAADTHSYEYTSTYACQYNTPGGGATDVMCMGAISGCAGNTPAQGQGPLVRLYRRELDASGNPIAGWALIGTTCYPDIVRGKPVLGLGPILAAFHNTPWAKPTAHIQPEGNVTLVTLATYFEVSWPTAGFQPGEIDTITLLATPVRIRPTVQSYTYVFGDGASSGATTSPGGPYPGGDITHAYPAAGTYDTHVDITYGGEFSVAGGAWVPIPDRVTVAGPEQPLTVKTSQARLVMH